MTGFTIHDRDATGGWIEIDGKNQRFYVYRKRDVIEVWIGGRTYRLVRTPKGQDSEGSGEIRSLMPGRIRRIEVKTGERVAAKQPLVVMESMKMETTLATPRDGIVTEVKCQVGQTVEMGELLVVVDVQGA
jgi:3-methylcrotonyl-CoA carboxylase alpha subunit